METKSVELPLWIIQSGVWVKHNWTTVVGVVVVAILASIVVEVIKHKGITTEDEQKAKKAVTWLLIVFTTLFSWLAYVVFFLQTNLTVIQQLPVIGSHAVEALGVATTLYSLRLNRAYKAFAAWANTVSLRKVKTTVPSETAQDGAALNVLD